MKGENMDKQKKVVKESYRVEIATATGAKLNTWSVAQGCEDLDCFGCAKGHAMLIKCGENSLHTRIVKVTVTEEVIE